MFVKLKWLGASLSLLFLDDSNIICVITFHFLSLTASAPALHSLITIFGSLIPLFFISIFLINLFFSLKDLKLMNEVFLTSSSLYIMVLIILFYFAFITFIFILLTLISEKCTCIHFNPLNLLTHQHMLYILVFFPHSVCSMCSS